MKDVAKTPQYHIRLDESKNRVYLTINGFWRNAQQVASYVTDWQKTLQVIKPNFTILTDLSTMLTHPSDVVELHRQVQEMVVARKIKYTAEVKPKDYITAAQAAKVAKTSQMPMKQFDSFEEADAFLDSLH